MTFATCPWCCVSGVHAGQLPARRVGHRWLVPTPALLGWLGAESDVENGENQADGGDGGWSEASAVRVATDAPGGE